MERRKFLTGLVSAIPLISTIRYGETSGVLDMAPKTDKFRELLIRSSAVKQSYFSDNKKLFNANVISMLDHINQEFNSSAPREELKIGQDAIFGNHGIIDENALKDLSEAWHPIVSLRELLCHSKIRLNDDNLSSRQWRTFNKNYSKLIIF